MNRWAAEELDKSGAAEEPQLATLLLAMTAASLGLRPAREP